MNPYEISEAVEFDSMEIARVINDCEYIQKHSTAEHDRMMAKVNAYEYIHDIIFGEESE